MLYVSVFTLAMSRASGHVLYATLQYSSMQVLSLHSCTCLYKDAGNAELMCMGELLL